ncbi:MAG TPA: hypothetical protein PKO15_07005 [Fibrobacteria bacterium]|nr:hypothetical protein [Fibrobacteria bacterium]HOX52856.1 hypothetical protein [Fibrobacteria bacterium]
MTAQNMISATLADDVKADVLQKLSDIRAKLDFLITLDPDQMKSLFKASNGYAPFVEKAFAAASTHPDILPRILSMSEYEKDVQLVRALTPIYAQVNELANALRDTLVAASSDAMNQSLEVYAAVKQHAGKVPGLPVVEYEMSVFFQKTRKKVAA